MACSVSKLLSAYHDGELDSAQSVDVERHIVDCPQCAAELAELAGLSRIFEQSPPQRLSQILAHAIFFFEFDFGGYR
jgi:anti-sigma factor RsiW